MLSVGAAQDALQIARVRIEGETVTIRGEQLEELLAGFDLWCQGHRELLMRRVG
jgi:hypothetical protein